MEYSPIIDFMKLASCANHIVTICYYSCAKLIKNKYRSKSNHIFLINRANFNYKHTQIESVVIFLDKIYTSSITMLKC